MRAVVFLLAATAFADEQFERKIRPLLSARCAGCHNPKTRMGGVDLGTSEGLAAAGRLIAPQDAEASRIYQVLTWSEKVKMPPTGKLSDAELATVREWINAGGVFPKEPPAAVTAGEKHWAFQPVQRVVPPAGINAIDYFIHSKLREKGIKPAPPAAKLTLLRRVTFNLTGLPPKPEEIEAFLADKSPAAFANVVDRLLASPRYGERWGRHWLDVARYADSTGMDEDNLYPHAWRYRDYVVDAFNRDTPYHQFIREQLAGDLLPDPKPVATGFLAIGPRPLAQQDRLQMIYDVVDEQIDTTSKAFLGLTVACARCHDHKFDPIPTKDYYALASIFASTTTWRNQGRPGSISYMHYAPLDARAADRYHMHRMRMLAKRLEMEDALAEHLNRENGAVRPRVAELLAAAWRVVAKNEPAPGKEVETWANWLRSVKDKAGKTLVEAADAENIAKSLADQYQASAAAWDQRLEGWRNRFAREALEDRALPERPKPDAESHPLFVSLTFNGGPMEVAESARVKLLQAEWQLLEKTLPPEPEYASAAADGPVVDQHIFVRGDIHNPGDAVAKGFPSAVSVRTAPTVEGSGRLQLAEWLTQPDHPLTARVMVNRIWQGHFGEGLVRTPSNWGRTGEKPTHPELLDYLAAKFIEGGWSVKAMHRLILSSSTYQMSTQGNREGDPGNRLWSRFARNRMSVEQIRDALLAIDGTLDLTQGGTLLETAKGKRQKIDVEESRRRSVYMPVRRGIIPVLFATFDFGDATTSSEGRTRTNIAPQALFLRNSKFVQERSRNLAKQLLQQEANARVAQAYLRVLNRRPEPADVDSGLTYVAALQARGIGEEDAWQSYCRVLFSTNEFLYLD